MSVVKNWDKLPREGGGCPVSGNMGSQDGWGTEQPDPVEDVTAYCTGIGSHDPRRPLPTQTLT